MKILKDLPELIQAEVITQDTADRIQAFYEKKSGQSTNKLFIIFGVLGAILVGLGIILIIAHNWDELSRTVKTSFAFVPPIVGQVLCAWVLMKKSDSIAWRESSASFLFFSVGACLALISQIYNIPGKISSYLLTWMLLCLPLIYVMQSSIASLLYLIGITAYTVEANYWSSSSSESHWYWLLLIMALPHYYRILKEKPSRNFSVFHHWIIPLSLIITLGTVAKETEELMFIAYFNLFGLLYLIGESTLLNQQKLKSNGYKVLGSLGTVILLLILSFDGFWVNLGSKNFDFKQVIVAPEFFASISSFLLAFGLLYLNLRDKVLTETKPLAFTFIFFMITFVIGLFSSFVVILMNIYIFAIGIMVIREGAKQDHLGILNYGLLIIAALVICRFFDTDLSFVFRGILFVLIGIGCFITNLWMLKKRKTDG